MTKTTPKVLAMSLMATAILSSTSYAAILDNTADVTLKDVSLADSKLIVGNTMYDDISALSIKLDDITVSDAAIKVAAKETKEFRYDKIVANVDTFLAIRANADSDSKTIGKLYKDSEATIVKRGKNWTKITSGNVTGYVNNAYVLFDEEAYEMLQELGKLTATTTASGVRVRTGAGIDCAVIGALNISDKYEVISEAKNGWVKIQYNKNRTGYVSAKYVKTSLSLEEAVSLNVVNNQESKAINEKINTNIIPAGPAGSSRFAAYSDEYLLACAVHMEASGESNRGKLAVANVILNRVKSTLFPNTISGVLAQKGQFPPAVNGKLSRILKSGPNNASIKAAKEALQGNNNIQSCLYFNRVGALKNPKIIIGNHAFK